MSILRSISEPARVPVRHAVNHHVGFFEDLIHQVKSELVAKLDDVQTRLDALERQTAVNGEVMADQLSLHTTKLRAIGTAIEQMHGSMERALAEAEEIDALAVVNLAEAHKSVEESTNSGQG